MNSLMKNFDLGRISKYRTEIFGICIIMIIIFHFTADYGAAVLRGNISTADYPIKSAMILKFLRFVGSIGVEIFVFLSGMGLCYSFSNNSNLKAFYKKRFFRIIPEYLIVGSVFWGIKDFIFKGTGIKGWISDISYYSLFTSGVRSIWFIALLIILYLVFPLIYKLIFKGGKYFAMILLVAVIFPIILKEFSAPLYKNIEILITRIPIFVVGVWVVPYIKENKKLSYKLISIFIIFSFLLNFISVKCGFKNYFYRYVDSVFAIGLLCLIVSFVVGIKKFKVIDAALKFAGTLSLELYLTHVTMRNLMKEFGFKAYRISHYCMMIAVAVFLSCALKLIMDRGYFKIGMKKQCGCKRS